jgi:hypothetical protein
MTRDLLGGFHVLILPSKCSSNACAICARVKKARELTATAIKRYEQSFLFAAKFIGRVHSKQVLMAAAATERCAGHGGPP